MPIDYFFCTEIKLKSVSRNSLSGELLDHTWICIFVCFLCLLFGCESLWNAGNRGSLKKDIDELLSNAKVSNHDFDCQMVGTTRTGICEGEMPLSSMNNVTSTLKLTEVTSDAADHEFASWLKDERCTLVKKGSGLRSFKSSRRATELRLKRGGAFEYFILIYDPSSGASCIQVSYSYG